MLVTIAAVVALILAGIDQVRAQGQSLTAWAVIVLCLALILTGFGIVDIR